MEKNSDILFGDEPEAIQRMKRETMDKASHSIRVNNYYTEEFAKKKMKQVEDVKKNSGYEVGYEGKTSHYNGEEDEDDDGDDDEDEKKKRKKLAQGGAAKIRKEYPGI